MGRRIAVTDLALVYCECTPETVLPDGTTPEWYRTPRDAALAVKRHVEMRDTYWCVHYVQDTAAAVLPHDTHVTSVVVDGLRYGPGGPTPA